MVRMVSARLAATEVSAVGSQECYRDADQSGAQQGGTGAACSPVRVRADHVEAVARLVGPAHGEGDQRRQVAREKVASAGFQGPLVALGQLLEARGQQAAAALLWNNTQRLSTRHQRCKEMSCAPASWRGGGGGGK